MIRNIIFSDPHCGHRQALLAPGTRINELEIGGSWEPVLTEANKDLWNLYNRLLTRADDCPYNKTAILIGDMFWGAKHPSGAFDLSERTQIDVALAVLEPLYDMVDLQRVMILSGTTAHEFEDNSPLRTLLRELQLIYPDVQTAGSHHALIDIDGYLVDAAHHGPHPGSRIWLDGNVATLYLRDLILRHLKSGKRPPDLVLRAHYHRRISVMVDIDGHEYRLIATPSMMGLNDYARQKTQSVYEITNGGFFFDVHQGSMLTPQWETRTIDLRTRDVWN